MRLNRLLSRITPTVITRTGGRLPRVFGPVMVVNTLIGIRVRPVTLRVVMKTRKFWTPLIWVIMKRMSTLRPMVWRVIRSRTRLTKTLGILITGRFVIIVILIGRLGPIIIRRWVRVMVVLPGLTFRVTWRSVSVPRRKLGRGHFLSFLLDPRRLTLPSPVPRTVKWVTLTFDRRVSTNTKPGQNRPNRAVPGVSRTRCLKWSKILKTWS